MTPERLKGRILFSDVSSDHIRLDKNFMLSPTSSHHTQQQLQNEQLKLQQRQQEERQQLLDKIEEAPLLQTSFSLECPLSVSSPLTNAVLAVAGPSGSIVPRTTPPADNCYPDNNLHHNNEELVTIPRNRLVLLQEMLRVFQQDVNQRYSIDTWSLLNETVAVC